MAQRSGVFVLYRKLPDDGGIRAYPNPKYEYMQQVVYRDTPTDVATTDLAKAMHLEKKAAFGQAIKNDGKWSVGELVSDAKGIRVEE